MAAPASGHTDVMDMHLVTDPAAADWISESGTPFEQLVSFGPACFEASGRLRFIPDPTRAGQEEGDADLPDDHPHDLVQTQHALHRLEAFTSTPGDCYFCVWEGYPYAGLLKLSEDSWVVLPHRRYALFSGALKSIDNFAQDFGAGEPVAPPAFVWPADHSWCFASDVDPHWAGIGASQAAVNAIVATAGLDVVHVRPEEPQPLFY